MRILSLTTSIVGVIGFLIGIQTLVEKSNKRDLSVGVLAPFVEVVNPSAPNATSPAMDLQLVNGGKPLDQEVTFANLTIFNRGKLTIKRDNLVGENKCLTIKTRTGQPILQAHIKAQSRARVKGEVEAQDFSQGIAQVTWTDMEQYDFIVLQVAFQGKGEDGLIATCSVEGQESEVFDLRSKSPTPIIQEYSQLRKRALSMRSERITLGWVAFVYAILFFIFFLNHLEIPLKKQHHTWSYTVLQIILPAIVVCSLLAWGTYAWILAANIHPFLPIEPAIFI